MIQLAAGMMTDAEQKKENLFKVFLEEIQKANQIKTKVQVDIFNSVLKFFFSRKKQENTEKTSLYVSLNEKYDKIKNVNYSNDIEAIKYDMNFVPTSETEYLNCIGFICYMYNIPASYNVKNFNKYPQFRELTNITDINQLNIGDVITWKYESGKFDNKKNPIYEYHASIWKGNDEIWECMDPKGVRTRDYKEYYDYMNTHNMKINTVKYFRYIGIVNMEKANEQ